MAAFSDIEKAYWNYLVGRNVGVDIDSEETLKSVMEIDTVQGSIVLSSVDAANAALTAQAAAEQAAADASTAGAEASQAALNTISSTAASEVNNALNTSPRIPQILDVGSGALVRIDAADGTATWLQANDSDGGPTTWSVSLLKSSLNIPTAGIMAIDDSRIPQTVDTSGEATLVRIDAFDGTSTWLQANATDGGPTSWSLSILQSALSAVGANYGRNLLASGLTDSTTDIGSLINTVFSQGYRHVIVPYRATPWPSLTTFTVPTGCKLEFEPGARIANNMAGIGGSVINGTLVNPSFTSTVYSVPSTAAHASAPDYAYPSRETLFKDGSRVIGDYFHEYAATGVHITGKDVVFLGNVRCKNMRQRTGWGQAFHIDGDGASQIYILGRIYAEDSDRGIEIEEGASDVHILGGGYAKNIYPNGYSGQPTGVAGVGDAAPYATYTFVYDLGHAHDFSGGGGDGLTHPGPKRIFYRGGFVAENCGSPILTCQRSVGTSATSIPRDSSMDELHIIGRSSTTGNDVEIGGINTQINRLVFSEGSGIAGGSFKINELSTGSGNFIGRIQGTAAAIAAVTIASSGAGLTKMQTTALTVP